MDSTIVTDSIKDAWSRTRTLLLTQRDPSLWLKYGFIAMLGATTMRGGVGMNFSTPMGSPDGDGGEWGGWSGPSDVGPQVVDAFRAAAEWLAANIANLVMLTIGLLTVWLVLSVAILYLRSVFRFIFVEAVAAPEEPRVGEAFRRYTGTGLSLLLWNLVLGLVPLLLAIIALVPMLSSIGLIISGRAAGAVLGAGGILALMGVIFFALLLLAMGRGLTEDFLVPAMYARRCGAIEGWRHVARAWQGELGNVIFFYLLKFVLAIAAAIVSGLVALVSLLLLIAPVLSLGGVVALIAMSGMEPRSAVVIFGAPGLIALVTGGLVFGYIVNVALLPVSVFFQAYSLAFVGRLDRSLRTI